MRKRIGRAVHTMTLEKQFEQEMIGIYMTAKKECGYNPTRFLS